jgi:glycolate oxidase
VDGRAEVLVDGGFVRGSDVVKALALGARAVLIGKLQVWALAAGGVECLVGSLQTLDEEIRHVLRLLGVARVTDLGPGQLRPGFPIPPEPAAEPYPHLPG